MRRLSDYNKMKTGQIFSALASQTVNKYIPTPEAANIILNYFVYNNFQDFNTWQQIAKTKVEYDYFQNQKMGFECKVTLKWEDRTIPTVIESADARSKRSAKKRALKKLVETLINQGYIGQGFKEENFVEKLPRRRKNDSDESEEEPDQERYSQKPALLSLLRSKQYQQIFSILSDNNSKWKTNEVLECWKYGLSIKSLNFLKGVISAYRGEQVPQQSFQPSSLRVQQKKILPRQFSYGKLVNNPLTEELTDFIRYQQLQKTYISPHQPIRQPDLQIRPIPSEHVIKEMKTHTPSRQQLTSYFHPIEGRKIFLSSLEKRQGEREEVQIELPRFEYEEQELPLKLVDQLYGLLPYYCLDYAFIQEVVQMMREKITSIQVQFDQSIEQKYQQQGFTYYMHNKNLLTAEFCYLLNSKYSSSWNNVSIQGMILPFKQDDQIFLFTCKEPEQILNRKINRRANFNEFQEMQQISMNQFVALVSKIDRSIVFIGQIMELTPNIKIYLPEMDEDTLHPEPFTMIRIYNSKIFEKTSSSIIKVAKYNMKLLEENTTILWQPPSFPILSVLSELLIEWQIIKSTVLIVSLDAEALQTELTNLGFKVVRITPKTEEKLLNKCNIVIASPSVVCCELLKNYAFSRVLIESSHQISEISSLSALVKGCKELYLMGDPFMPRMQVGSPYCIKNEMGRSLLERLYSQGHRTETYFSRLENSCEYRNVMEWADHYIYNRKLMLFGNEMQTPIIKGFPWPSTDYRLCFLNHPNISNDVATYLEQQAYICSAICGQVIKSGYTKIQQITCSVASPSSLPFLQKRMSILLKMLGCTEMKLFNKYMNNLCRIVSGSIYFRSQLSILMLGCDLENLSFRELLGAMRQGRRGVIVIGDMKYFSESSDYANFISWCKQKKLINIVDPQSIPQLQ